ADPARGNAGVAFGHGGSHHGPAAAPGIGDRRGFRAAVVADRAALPTLCRHRYLGGGNRRSRRFDAAVTDSVALAGPADGPAGPRHRRAAWWILRHHR